MKQFVIVALFAVASAARLEHLENSYLPPNQYNSAASSFGGFNGGNFASSSSSNGFGAVSRSGYNGGSSFNQATSNKYLTPNEGFSASNVAPEYVGAQVLGAQNYNGQQYSGEGYQYNKPQSAPQQYAIPSTLYGTPDLGSAYTAPNYQQYPEQSAAASSQYLAPQSNSVQNIPQQSFDKETGYHY